MRSKSGSMRSKKLCAAKMRVSQNDMTRSMLSLAVAALIAWPGVGWSTTRGSANYSITLESLEPLGTSVQSANYTLRSGFVGAGDGIDGQLLNISTRMRVLTGDQVLIGGFIVIGIDP